MKKTIILIAASLIAMHSYAEVWSLEKCVSYAIEHNINVQLRGNEVESGKLSVAQAKSRFLPTLNGYANQSWSFGRGITSDNTYSNTNTSNTSLGLQMNLPVFDGLNTVRQIEYTKASLAAAFEQFEAAKDDVTLNVLAAYLQVLYSKEMKEVAKHQVELSTFELGRQKALLEAGKIPEVDMLEAESQLAQDKYSMEQAENDCRLALIDLAQMLNLSNVVDFDVEPLDKSSNYTELMATPEQVYAQAININHTVQASRLSVSAADKNVSLAKTGYIPSISFNASLGSNYYTLSGHRSQSFNQQMKNNFSKGLGFSLSVPIFDALQTRNSVKRAKVQKVTAQLQQQQVEQELFKSIEQAYMRADGAQKKLKSALVAENATAKAFTAMSEKYGIGRATPTEYQQSKTKALRAKAEALQAHFELILRNRILDFYAKGSI
ncbi:MAG: TolC family protein [Muribaculum sp.]|nr:TolC family protein [Muribaculaceae bacterium]MCM1080979.1 TolC family protein [Muribaculum sp.]